MVIQINKSSLQVFVNCLGEMTNNDDIRYGIDANNCYLYLYDQLDKSSSHADTVEIDMDTKPMSQYCELLKAERKFDCGQDAEIVLAAITDIEKVLK